MRAYDFVDVIVDQKPHPKARNLTVNISCFFRVGGMRRNHVGVAVPFLSAKSIESLFRDQQAIARKCIDKVHDPPLSIVGDVRALVLVLWSLYRSGVVLR